VVFVAHRGADRRLRSRIGGRIDASRGFGALVGIGVGIDAPWGRRQAGSGASWGRRRVGRDADRRRAQRGVLGRWWAGRPASPQTVETTRWSRRRFWAAPTPIRAKWGCEPPPRAMGMRGATEARDGVGAAQNRRTALGGKRDVGGDAGRPAHQRHAAPRCATRHHDHFPPVCGPRCADSHPSAAPRRVDSHLDIHPRHAAPRCARHHQRPHRTPMIPRRPPIPTPMRPRLPTRAQPRKARAWATTSSSAPGS
jgi:hypothetical protein